MTVKDYGRRLTYARLLGQTASAVHLSEIEAITYDENQLPRTQDGYERKILGAYSRGNVDFCSRRGEAKEMLLEALQEGITSYNRLIVDIEKELASIKA